MLEDSKVVELSAAEAVGTAVDAKAGVNKDIRVCLVAQSNMRITKTPHDGGMTLEWSDSSAKSRNLKPVGDLVEQLLLQVLAIEKKQLRAQVGLYERAGEYYPMASFIVHPASMHEERTNQLHDLLAEVPRLLMAGAGSLEPTPWMLSADVAQIEEVTESILMTCGGRSIPAVIDIMIDGVVVGVLRDQFAPSPKSGNLTPEREEFVGCVVGYSIKKGLVEFEEIAGRHRDIRSQAGSLDAEKLGLWVRDKKVVTAEVDTTKLPSGKLSHEMVSIQ